MEEEDMEEEVVVVVLSATSAGNWGTSPVTALVQPLIKIMQEGVVTLVLRVVRLATLAVDTVSVSCISGRCT